MQVALGASIQESVWVRKRKREPCCGTGPGDLFGAMMVLCGGAAANAEEARIALLIGNQNYAEKVGPLKNPHSDVALIEAALQRLGFTVTVVKEESYRDMAGALKRHVAGLRKAGPGAIGFFYYSGHGVANPDTG